MGRDAAQQILARYPRSNNTQLTNLVGQIGRRIVPYTDRNDLPYTFIVLDTSEVNASAVPGYVFVNRGLIDFVNQDQDQLASVIAHEIAHNARRHAAIQVEQQLGASLAIQLLSSGKQIQVADLIASLALLGYGRSMELDADHYGMIYMNRAGYDPRGTIEFFQKLEQYEGKQPGGLSVYFRTHPPTSERIRRAQQELQQLQSQR
jgi:predicted Zn-dependent protease